MQQVKDNICAALQGLQGSYGGDKVLTDAAIFTGLTDPVISEIVNNLTYMENFEDLQSCNK